MSKFLKDDKLNLCKTQLECFFSAREHTITYTNNVHENYSEQFQVHLQTCEINSLLV